MNETDDRRASREQPSGVGTVIDLRRPTPDGVRTKVRVEPGRNPLETMSPEERMRLFIRVLCELVAYGELEELSDA